MNMNQNKMFFIDKNSSKVSLPGKSLYPFEELYIKTFTLEDLYQITTISLQKDKNRLYDFMQRHISENVMQLTEADFNHLLFWERLNSYSFNPLILYWDCDSCSKRSEATLDETKIEYKELDPYYTKEGMIIDLFSGEKVIWKIPTLQDIKISEEFCKTNSQLNYSIAETAQCITFHSDPNLSLKEKYTKVANFKPDDFSIFIELMTDFTNYGMQNVSKVNCIHCGHSQNVDFKFDVTSVFPSFPSPGSLRSRILPNKPSNESKSVSNTDGRVQQTNISQEEIRREVETRGAEEGERKESNRQDEIKTQSYDEFMNNKNN